MNSFISIAFFAAVALFGCSLVVEANPLAYPVFPGLLPAIPAPYPNDGKLLVSADLDVYFDLVEAVSIVFDTLVAKLAPIVAALLPVLLPLIDKFISCVLNC